MPSIDSIGSQALYLAATQSASQQSAKQTQSKKNEKAGKASRLSFSEAVQRAQEELTLAQEGLPPEIAGMSTEDAVVFLKDAVDIASDELKAKNDLVSMENYRKKVRQFMQFIVKHTFEVERTVERRKIDLKTRKPPVRVQIKIIDEKLNRLATDMMYNQASNLQILAKVEEINGLLVDVMAG